MIAARASELAGYAHLTSYSLVLISCFALAALVMEFFDISLPRGDSVGVSGALNSAALIMFGPTVAILSGIVGVLGAFAIRPKRGRTVSIVIEICALVSGLIAASSVHAAIDLTWRMTTPGTRYFEVLSVAGAYLVTELVVVQAIMGRIGNRSLGRLIRANVYRQAPLLLAQLSACFLTILIYPTMREWSLFLVVVLLLLIRQSYALLLDTRDTYRTTVQVLVEAAEATDSRRIGHAERTAEIAREIGARFGVSPSELERVSYAALLHDIDAIGSEGNSSGMLPSDVLRGLAMFGDLVPVLQTFELGHALHQASVSDSIAAFIVALASDIDVLLHESLREVHSASETAKLSGVLPLTTKAGIVASALKLGYGVPAIS